MSRDAAAAQASSGDGGTVAPFFPLPIISPEQGQDSASRGQIRPPPAAPAVVSPTNSASPWSGECMDVEPCMCPRWLGLVSLENHLSFL